MSAWRKALRWTSWGLAALPVIALAAFGVAAFDAQRADYGWRPVLARPAHPAGRGPRVAIDHAHHNASTAHFWGRYWPFARLLRAEGYRVRFNTAAFSAQSLADTQVLIVANAAGAGKAPFFGINLPLGGGGDRAAPAFDRDEIAALESWVAQGGRLLLVADHAPFGAANAALGEAFGVRMHRGFAEVPGEKSDPLRFTRANGRLNASHPILSGADGGEPVACVQTFTGQSLDGPPGATALLRLPPNAVETVDERGSLREMPAGAAQGLAFAQGHGRVVVLGEAAMLTAQVADRVPFGLQLPGCDNVAFARNLMRWLSADLSDPEGDRHDRR